MEAEVKIKASMQMVENNIEAQAKKQGQKAGKAFQEGAKRTGKGGIFDMLKSNGGVLNGLKGVLTGGGIKSLLNPGMLLKSLTGPLGIALTAITGAVAIVKTKMQSAQKILDRQIGISQQRIADKEAQMRENDDKNLKNIAIVEKLNEYVNKYKKGQVLSDGEIKNSIDLVKELDNSYKGLGISINTLSRSVDGFNDSITEMIKNSALQNKIKQLEQLSDEYNGLLNSLTLRAANGLNETQIMAMRNIGIQFTDGYAFDFQSSQAINRRLAELEEQRRRDFYARNLSFFNIDSSGFMGGWHGLEKTDGEIRDLSNASQKQLDYERALQEVENSIFYKIDKAFSNILFGSLGEVSDAISPYLERIKYNLGAIDYDQTSAGKLDKLFDFSGLLPDEKINKMKDLIKQFTQARDLATTQQKADSLQKVIDGLKKMLHLEKQRNKYIQERANLQKNLIKQRQQEANIMRSNEWMKQDDLDKQIYNFNKQREWDNADTDVERRRILEKRLSDYQTSRKNLSDVNDEIASKRYGNEAEKSQNAIRIQELEDFSAFIGRLKEKQDTYAGLKGKTGFEFYESILNRLNKEIPYVEKNYKDQGAGFKKEDRKQWETWLIESKQRRNVLESLLKNIDPNLSNQEKGALVEERLKRQIDSRKNKVFLFDDERAKDSAQIAKNETQIKKIMLQELKIKKQMKELDKRRQEYFGSIVRNNDWEEEKFRAQVKGDWDSYLGDEVQIEDNNSKMNMTMDEKLSWMQQKRRERNLNVRRMIKGQAESMYDSMLPNTYENDVERTVRELEKANKITLQPDMVDKIRQLLKIKWDKQDAENYFNSIRGELNIKTNSLTARGGFAGGAYVPKLGDYQQNAVALQRQTNTNLVQIKQLIRDLGKI